jgi:ABC-2 type transport system permease protein
MISWSRIKGVMIQEGYITRRESALWFDLLIFSAMSVIVFGLLSQYLTQHSNSDAATNVILGMLLWEVLRINQYSVSLNSMWNMWSHNLTNIFITPVSIAEYIIANCAISLLKTAGVFAIISIISSFIFNFNILSIGVPTFLLGFTILSVFAWSVGWLLLGLVFRYGTSIQAVTWGAIMFFQPLTATFFPVSVLPGWLQAVAYLFPPTYVFEASRNAVSTGQVDWQLFIPGLALTVVWGFISVSGFVAIFHRSRVIGQFARNDS